jgi:hypothetical protein
MHERKRAKRKTRALEARQGAILSELRNFLRERGDGCRLDSGKPMRFVPHANAGRVFTLTKFKAEFLGELCIAAF